MEQEKDKQERLLGDKGNKPKRGFNFYWIYGIIIVVILALQLVGMGGGQSVIDNGTYQEYVNNGDVERVGISGGRGEW